MSENFQFALWWAFCLTVCIGSACLIMAGALGVLG